MTEYNCVIKEGEGMYINCGDEGREFTKYLSNHYRNEDDWEGSLDDDTIGVLEGRIEYQTDVDFTFKLVTFKEFKERLKGLKKVYEIW